jgi:hypothetical protein
MAGEDPAEFRSLLQDFVRRLQPADNAELAYVEQMVSALWRLRRAEAIEVAILNQIVGAPVRDPRLAALAAAAPDLERIRRYQQRLLRDHYRAAKALAELRATQPCDVCDALCPNEPEGETTDQREKGTRCSGPEAQSAAVARAACTPFAPARTAPAPSPEPAPAPLPNEPDLAPAA